MFFLMIRQTPVSKRTDTLLPNTALCRSVHFGYEHPCGASSNGLIPIMAASRHLAGTSTSGAWPDRGRSGSDQVDGHFDVAAGRSEEHTSELQSLMRISYAVLCLKKNNYIITLTFLTDHCTYSFASP